MKAGYIQIYVYTYIYIYIEREVCWGKPILFKTDPKARHVSLHPTLSVALCRFCVFRTVQNENHLPRERKRQGIIQEATLNSTRTLSMI